MLMRDKVAIVSGAASMKGIGWATARRFAEEGARVALLDLNAGAVQEAAKAIGNAHQGYVCDVRDAAQCQQVVEKIIADFGHVDILVNNAGVSQSKRLMDSTMDDYDLVMDVSLRGAYNMSRALVPHLRSRPHYAAAKGGVQTLAKAMARELGPDGIRVNAVAPGLIDTELLVGKIDGAGKQRVADSAPLGRLGTPLDIADAFVYLCSDMSRFVTGVVLDVNGGLHIH
ncbi:MAG: SDR family oxidoreductase [Oxalobacteraceae bacterium]|nr:SDR family oxidoreductase [Oxalobacteraceae bacterium]